MRICIRFSFSWISFILTCGNMFLLNIFAFWSSTMMNVAVDAYEESQGARSFGFDVFFSNQQVTLKLLRMH